VIQEAYNKEHGIVPATVIRAVMNINPAAGTTDYYEIPKIRPSDRAGKGGKAADVDISEQIRAMRAEMFTAAEALDFERAAALRDELRGLQKKAGVDEAPIGARGAYAGGVGGSGYGGAGGTKQGARGGAPSKRRRSS
jgi:excinuclease ABC subunit B